MTYVDVHVCFRQRRAFDYKPTTLYLNVWSFWVLEPMQPSKRERFNFPHAYLESRKTLRYVLWLAAA